ncbi:MAG: cobalt ECF transporter T component CbiQ [Candidatus Omnitrophica bacterium]|nr:cobalt ECF transporter T component CbiQ [Candidatus Omnitrophota bacterium]
MIRTSSLRNGSFIERSLLAAVSFIKEATLFEEYASRQGFMQGLAPGIKILTIFLLILTAVILKDLALIGLLYGLCLALALFSEIPITFFLLRTLIFIPLFSLFIAIPAIFSSVSPGQVLRQIHIFGITGMITSQGCQSAALLVARITTTVSLAVLVSLTTKHAELLKSLRHFGVPQIFVMTVSMCYRYLYLFAVMVENICGAIKSRVGIVIPHKRGQKFVAWNIANIWSRTNQMSEEVYRAMLSRGYTGEPRSLQRIKKNE